VQHETRRRPLGLAPSDGHRLTSNFEPAPPPHTEIREPLIRRIGKASIRTAARSSRTTNRSYPTGHVPAGRSNPDAPIPAISSPIGSQGAPVANPQPLLRRRRPTTRPSISVAKTGSGQIHAPCTSIITAGACRVPTPINSFYLRPISKKASS